MLARIVLWVMIVGSAIGGLGYLLMPTPLLEAAGLTGSASGITDVRAVYGGLQLGIAAYLLWAIQSEERMRDAILLVAMLLSSVALCRVIGLVVDGSPSNFNMLSLTAEVVTGAAAFLAYRRPLSPAEQSPA